MRLVLVFLAALLAGCSSARITRAPVPQVKTGLPSLDYVDLQPGWRLRVVTPLPKSGGYRVADETQQVSGSTMTLSAGKDFIGYETSYYAVQPRGRTGVRIRFTSAESVRDGKAGMEQRPAVPLFQLPGNVRYVRLLFLVRVSQADHNMAVLAARDEMAMDEVTRQVQADPAGGCRAHKSSVCQWIPAGIAVRAEKLKEAELPAVWVPAR